MSDIAHVHFVRILFLQNQPNEVHVVSVSGQFATTTNSPAQNSPCTTRWRFDYFDMCSLSHETYIKWRLRCSIVWRKGKGTKKLYVTSQTLTVNEIELVDTTKIMLSLRKAKPEWFSPSDIRQVIFADFYKMVWNLHQIKAKKY